MQPHTLSIGGATYDIFVPLDRDTVQSGVTNTPAFTLPLGNKIRVKNVVETCGGGASNTAVGLARLGCHAGFCGVVGDDQWGEALRRNFEQEGVDCSCLTVVEKEISSFSIILSAGSGERVILYDPGTNDHLHDVTFDREHAGKTNWVYLNHIQQETCVIEDDIIKMLSVESGPKLTWNPGGCQIDVGISAKKNCLLLAHTHLLQLNKQEALQFTKKKTVEDALQVLLEEGVQIVLITDGKNGSVACDSQHIYRCPVPEENTVVDTTGAGDAFGTGVTWGLATGRSLPEALKAGTINATSVVGAVGAQAGLLTETEMLRRLKETPLHVDIQPL